MKIVTFDCPEGPNKNAMTRILGKLWINYLISQNEIDIDPKKREQEDYRLSDEETYLYGQLMGEIAKSEDHTPS